MNDLTPEDQYRLARMLYSLELFALPNAYQCVANRVIREAEVATGRGWVRPIEGARLYTVGEEPA